MQSTRTPAEVKTMYWLALLQCRHNLKLAQNACATARHYGAALAPFELAVREAQSKVDTLTTEYRQFCELYPE